MKNLFLLPTDKPCKLHFDNVLFTSPNEQLSSTINSIVEGRHIYITSDEEIKDSDWLIFSSDGFTKLMKVKSINIDKTSNIDKIMFESTDGDFVFLKYSKKIILTTDQDLISNGIQAIDDEFIQWFIKNPTCNFVDINVTEELQKNGIKKLMQDEYYQKFPEDLPNCVFAKQYKIIINNEESKSVINLKELESLNNEINEALSICPENKRKMYSEEDMINFMQFIISQETLSNTSSVSKETAQYYLQQFKNK